MLMTPECDCPHVNVGSIATKNRAWSDLCPVHGVGTTYFRELREHPYGFRGMRELSRAAYLKTVVWNREAEVPGWDE